MKVESTGSDTVVDVQDQEIPDIMIEDSMFNSTRGIAQIATTRELEAEARSGFAGQTALPPSGQKAVVEIVDNPTVYKAVRDTMEEVVPFPVGDFVSFGMDTTAKTGEDILNAGIDGANAISKLFGNDLSLENVDYITKTLPDSGFQTAARTILQLATGYAAALKGLQAVKGAVNVGKMTERAYKTTAMIATEGTFNDIEEGMMLERAVLNTPFAGDFMEYMNEEFIDGSQAAKRLKVGLYGLFESQIADKIFDVIKARKIFKRIDKKSSELPPEVPSTSGAQAPMIDAVEMAAQKQAALETQLQGVVDKLKDQELTYKNPDGTFRNTKFIAGDEIPPVPMTVSFTEDGIVGDISAVPKIVKDLQGKYGPNKIEMRTKDGKRVFNNATTIDSPDALRSQINNMFEQNADFFAKTSTNNEALKKLAASYDISVEDLLTWTAQNGLNPGQLLAARMIEVNAQDQLLASIKAFDQGQLSMEELAILMDTVAFISRSVSDMKTLASNILREAGVPVAVGEAAASRQNSLMLLKRGQDLIRHYGEDGMREISRAMARINNDQVTDSLERIGFFNGKTWSDLIIQLGMSNMLSSPSLIARNVISSASMLLEDVATTGVAAGIGKGRSIKNAIKSRLAGEDVPADFNIEFGEATVKLLGMVQGVSEATRISYNQIVNKLPPSQKMFKQIGEDLEFMGVREGRKKVSDEILYASRNSERLFKTLGTALGMSGKVINWQDEFTKHVAMRMKLNEEAYRIAQREIREAGTGVNTAVRRAEIINKTLTDNDLMNRLSEFGEQVTFTGEVGNPILQSIVNMSNPYAKNATAINHLFFHLMPFARANINAMTYTFERIPVANLMMKRVREQFASPDPRVRDMMMAKSVTLPALAGSVALMMNLMDEEEGLPNITGKYSPKETGVMRSSGIQENSIKIGGQYVTYLPETPVGALLSMFATINEIQDIVGPQNDEDSMRYVQDVSTLLLHTAGEVFNPEFMVGTLAQIMDAYEKGDAEAAAGIMRVSGDVASRYAGFYTAFFRRLLRSDMAEQLFGEDMGFARDLDPGDPSKAFLIFLGQIKQKTMDVYMPLGMAYRRDFFGNKIPHKKGLGGFISPFNFSEINQNKTMKEMVRLASPTRLLSDNSSKGIQFGEYATGLPKVTLFPNPSRSLTVVEGTRPIRLNNNDYERLSLYSAGIDPDNEKGTIKGLLSYESQMQKLFESDAYKKAPEHIKGIQASKVHRFYLEMGRKMFIAKTFSKDELRQGLDDLRKSMRF